MKISRFRVVENILRHGRVMRPGVEFWIKKSSSRVHVDRWLAEGRIKELSADDGHPPSEPTTTMKTLEAAPPARSTKKSAAVAPQSTRSTTTASVPHNKNGAKTDKPGRRGQSSVPGAGLARSMKGEGRLAMPAAEPGVRDYDPKTIRRSPFNREIDESDEDFLELVADVQENGVLQNGIIRPCVDPDPRIQWEIVAGEGRWQAALRTGHTFPAKVCECDDTRAIEIQAIENMKRRNLNAIDEAMKYEQLLEAYGVEGMKREDAVSKIEDTTGKAQSTIYERLSLLQLPPQVQTFVRKGRLPASHAALLTRIKDPVTTAKLAAEIVGAKDGVMPFREAKGEIDDAVKCEKNLADYNRKKTEWEAKGWPILPVSRTDAIFGCHENNGHWWLKNGSSYVTPDQYCDLPGANYRHFDKLWKKPPTATLGRLPDFRPVLIYLRTEADAAAKAGGKLKVSSNGRATSRPESEVKAERECKEHREEFLRAVPQIVQSVEVNLDSAALWRFFASHLVEQLGSDPVKQVAKRRYGLKADAAHDALPRKMAKMSVHELRGLCTELLLFRDSWPSRYCGGWGKSFRDAAALAGVTLSTWGKGEEDEAS